MSLKARGVVAIATGTLVLGGAIGAGATYSTMQPEVAMWRSVWEDSSSALQTCLGTIETADQTLQSMQNAGIDIGESISSFFDSSDLYAGDPSTIYDGYSDATDKILAARDDFDAANESCGMAVTSQGS